MLPALNRLRPCAFLATLLIGFFLSHASGAQDRPYTISVSGTAEIRTAPDMATVWFGVVTRDENPDRARQLNEDAAAQAMNAVRALGIPERDLRLETVQLQPLREYDPDRRIYREDGFEATRQVEVIVRDLDRLPNLMAAIVSEGANRVNSIQYGLEDKDAAELEALTEAARKVREKASVLAGELGWVLGKAIQINEQGVHVPQPRMQMEMAAVSAMAKDTGNPDAYAAGELTVSASVTVVFSLADKE